MRLKQHFPRSTSITEIKLRLRLFCCQLDHIHLVQLFLTGHRHVSGRNTCFVSCNKIFQFADFLLLTTVCRFQLCFLHRIHFLEMIVVADITVQLLILHMIDDIYYLIEKRDVM